MNLKQFCFYSIWLQRQTIVIRVFPIYPVIQSTETERRGKLSIQVVTQPTCRLTLDSALTGEPPLAVCLFCLAGLEQVYLGDFAENLSPDASSLDLTGVLRACFVPVSGFDSTDDFRFTPGFYNYSQMLYIHYIFHLFASESCSGTNLCKQSFRTKYIARLEPHYHYLSTYLHGCCPTVSSRQKDILSSCIALQTLTDLLVFLAAVGFCFFSEFSSFSSPD